MEESNNLISITTTDKLARLLLGFHLDYLVYQPHNFIIDSFEKEENGDIIITYRIGEPSSIKTIDDNENKVATRTCVFSSSEFKKRIKEIMQFLNIEDTQEKEDEEKLYKFLDNPNRDINWVYKKIKEFRRLEFDRIKANKRDEILSSDAGKAALIEYQKILKEIENDIRTETFGNQYRSTCHYMKYVLPGATDDISIRFFYQFEDRKEYEGKFVMKDHRTKNYIVLDTNIALHILSTTVIQNQYRVISFPDRNKYVKLVVEGYYKDGERVSSEERVVRLDSEKNIGQQSSQKLLKRIKQKEKTLKAPEELKIATAKIKELQKEIKALSINNNAPIHDYINAYHSQLKKALKRAEKV